MALTEQQRVYQQQYRLRTNNQSQRRYMQNRADRLANDPQAFARDQLKKLRAGAEKRGIKFKLSLKQLTELLATQKICALSGRAVTFRIGDKNKASVDRIDSNGCYELGNVQIVVALANIMKREHEQADIIALAHDISRYHSVKPKGRT